MKSAIPKVLHDLFGWPLVRWPVEAARAAGAARVVVVGGPDRALGPVLPASVELAVQAQPRGTGDAVLSAAPYIDPDARVIVVAGDVPLISAEAIRGLADAHAAAGAAATMLTMVLDDASGYGRVVRAQDGSVDRVVETKVAGEATPEELAISEVNTGVFAFEGGLVLEALRRVRPDNAQGELYLPDALPALRKRGHAVAAVVTGDATLTLGVNDRADLAIVRALAQRRILDAHMRAGVTVLAPEATVVDASVAIGPDTVLELGTTLRGATRLRTASRSARSPICAPARCCDPAARSARSSRSRTPTWGRGPRSPICRTWATPTSGSARTWARARSPPTTTASTSTARRSATTSRAAWTPRSWRRSRWATGPGPPPARWSPMTSRRAPSPSPARASATSRTTPGASGKVAGR